MTILATTDRSDNSRAALRLAAHLADRLGEELVVMSALELWERRDNEILPTFEGVEIEADAHALQLVEEFATEVLGETPTIRVTVGHPPTGHILEVAEEVGATMIVAGTSGQSKIREAFFGSTISAVARQSTCPVLAVPPDFEGGVGSILAPVDLSACSEASLAVAGRLAEQLDAKLYVQHSAPYGAPTVSPPLVYIPESAGTVLKRSREQIEAMVEKAGLTARATKVWTNVGPPHPDILRAVEDHDIDLVVMGTHGRKGVAKFFLGSTAERMLRDRSCPVLVVRHLEDQ